MLKESAKRGLGIVPSYGLRVAIKKLLVEVPIFFKHRSGLRKVKKFRYPDDLKVHLGCGQHIKEGWLNIDLSDEANIKLDLREPLRFRDDSCSLIYSEHFLEHIDYPEPVGMLLKSCCRMLRPGGVFSAAVPDIELVLNSYVGGGSDEYYAAQRKWNPEWCETQMEHVNFNFRQGEEHRFAYDFETLKRLLESCGFTEVRRREFDPDLDSEDRIVGSLYIECIKPRDE